MTARTTLTSHPTPLPVLLLVLISTSEKSPCAGAGGEGSDPFKGTTTRPPTRGSCDGAATAHMVLAFAFMAVAKDEVDEDQEGHPESIENESILRRAV